MFVWCSGIFTKFYPTFWTSSSCILMVKTSNQLILQRIFVLEGISCMRTFHFLPPYTSAFPHFINQKIFLGFFFLPTFPLIRKLIIILISFHMYFASYAVLKNKRFSWIFFFSVKVDRNLYILGRGKSWYIWRTSFIYKHVFPGTNH
jgi:hypothetical protein